MPSTINGIGTSYFGHDNLSRYWDVCEFCGKSCYLTSYDTTSYFVFIFLPLIPLGKKRVAEKCSLCTMHRVMPLKEWYKTKEKAIYSLLE